MKIHTKKEDAFAEARARREAGETVRILQAKTVIAGSAHRAPELVVHFFVGGAQS
jgi:hypothetical protein